MSKWKMGEYKEDSTKGKAMIRPKRYKGDSLVQVWIDRRWLASLSVWLESNGVRTRYMSDVLRESLRELYQHLVKTGEVSELDTATAGELLERMYRIELNPSGRGERNLLHNKLLSTYKGEEVEFRTGISKREEMRECITNVNRVEVSENDPLVAVATRAAAYAKSMSEFKFDPEKVDNSKVVVVGDESNNVDEEAKKRKAMFDACKTHEEKIALKKRLEKEWYEKQEKIKYEEKIKEKLERKRLKALEQAGIASKQIERINSNDDAPRPITDEEWQERIKKEQNDLALFNSDAMLGPKQVD